MVNRVMRKLGERELNGSATELTTDYELLIGDIINDVKEEIENAHQWRALRSTETVTVAANAATATITNANERSTIVNIVQANNPGLIPLCFDVTDGVNNIDHLREIDLSEMIWRDTLFEDDYQDPSYFALDNTAGDVLQLWVHPRPADQRTIEVTLCIPQARLAKGDLATTISIPTRPLLMGAVWHAMEERGEELGTRGFFNEARFNEALQTAIARDSAGQGDALELVIS